MWWSLPPATTTARISTSSESARSSSATPISASRSGNASPGASTRFSTSCPSLPMPPCSRRAGGWPPPWCGRRRARTRERHGVGNYREPRASRVLPGFRCAAREDPRHVSARASRQRPRVPHRHPHAGEAGHRERLLTRQVVARTSRSGARSAAPAFANVTRSGREQRDGSQMRETRLATISAAGCTRVASATLCPAQSESASMSPVVLSTGIADE